jgi:hypothetical protein
MGGFRGNLIALLGFLSITTWKQVRDMNNVLQDFADDENAKATQSVSHHHLRAHFSPVVKTVPQRPEEAKTPKG